MLILNAKDFGLISDADHLQHEKIQKAIDTCYKDGGGEVVCGMYGLCIDSDGADFDYLIADNYLPWKEVPEGYETRTLPVNSGFESSFRENSTLLLLPSPVIPVRITDPP